MMKQLKEQLLESVINGDVKTLSTILSPVLKTSPKKKSFLAAFEKKAMPEFSKEELEDCMSGQRAYCDVLRNAVISNNNDAVKVVMDAFKSMDIRGYRKVTAEDIEWHAFNCAVQNGKPDIVKALTQEGYKATTTHLMEALCNKCDPEMVRAVLENGVDPNYSGSLEEHQGSVLARWAMGVYSQKVRKGDMSDSLKTLSVLQEYGVDVNRKTVKGEPALVEVYRIARDFDAINALIDAGADVHAKDTTGKSLETYKKEDIVLMHAIQQHTSGKANGTTGKSLKTCSNGDATLRRAFQQQRSRN